MAIEIREVVIKATISKSPTSVGGDFLSRQEFLRGQDKLMDRIMSKVKDMIAEERSSR